MKPKQDDSDWIFHNYRGTNFDDEILCEPTSSDNKEKEGDNPSNNRLVNLKKLTTNMDNFWFSKNVHMRSIYRWK